MTGDILVINAGSSSIKFRLFTGSSDPGLLASGQVADIGGQPFFRANDNNDGQTDKEQLAATTNHESALNVILEWISGRATGKLAAVAHRVVHGGSIFKSPVRVTPAIIDELETLVPLAPLHQPHNLSAIRILEKIKPGTAQIACFDTAFHAGHEPLFTNYALPQRLRDQGIRRYGFHGLSYEWIAHILQRDHPELAGGRVVAAHLGNGASLCALRNGVSIDTTMGMTALDGLPMGTRCGSIDPGAVIYMLRQLGLSVEEVETALYNESGLKGLSGITNNVKLLQDSDNPAARFALDYFCLKAAQHTAMMAVALGGIDGIVFTGGIGENSEAVRHTILAHLSFLQPFETRVIPADEEWIMARHAVRTLKEN